MCSDYFTMFNNMHTFAQRINNRCDQQGQYKYQIFVNNKVVTIGNERLIIKAYSDMQAFNIFVQLKNLA